MEKIINKDEEQLRAKAIEYFKVYSEDPEINEDEKLLNFYFGIEYLKGENVEKDFEKARLYFETLVKTDFYAALDCLDYMYKTGKIQNSVFKSAEQWYIAEKIHGKAAEQLAYIFTYKDSFISEMNDYHKAVISLVPEESLLFKVINNNEENYDKGIFWCELSAETLFNSALYQLILLYNYNRENEIDRPPAAGKIAYYINKFYPLDEKSRNTSFNNKDCIALIRRICKLAEMARRDSLLGLENFIKDEKNIFLKTGLTLVSDGINVDIIKTIVEFLFDMENKEGINLIAGKIMAEGIVLIQQGFNPFDIESKLYEIYHSCQTLEERMAVYAQMLETLKENMRSRPGDESICSRLKFESDEEYFDFAAALAYFEEYELLKRFLEEGLIRVIATVDPEIVINVHLLNNKVSPEFLYWRPSPFYFITTKKARENMKDPIKMIKFLADNGADINYAAADGSTALLNQTFQDCESVEILELLLKLGADPNKTGKFDDVEWAPLAHCLIPGFEEIEGSVCRVPFNDFAISQAKVLLENGADPNFTTENLSDYPPLIMAVRFGFITEEGPQKGASADGIYEFIEYLISKGADVNFKTSIGSSPLLIAKVNKLTKVEEILVKHGAELHGDIEEILKRGTGNYNENEGE